MSTDPKLCCFLSSQRDNLSLILLRHDSLQEALSPVVDILSLGTSSSLRVLVMEPSEDSAVEEEV